MYSTLLFYFLLILVAFMYSSVGHGGASGYLALMALFSMTPATMRPTALILNTFVSAIGFIQYYRSGYFQWKLFWPFAVTSIPCAFLGGLIRIDAGLYKNILAVLLLFPIIRLAGFKIKTSQPLKKLNLVAAFFTGAVIGLFSGMIGIGGGIILSPVILLLHWADMKQTAAVSALFIFVNSLAGLAGLYSTQFEFTTEMTCMIIVALTGGLAGSYLGAKKFNSLFLRRILAVVLFIAFIKLVIA